LPGAQLRIRGRRRDALLQQLGLLGRAQRARRQGARVRGSIPERLRRARPQVSEDSDRFALAGSASWQEWTVDLETLQATPLPALGFHAPGLYSTRIDGDTFVAVPTAEYDSTSTYRLTADGNAELRWQSTGWQTRLFKLNRQ